jgi:hypothetical protein
LGGRRGGGEAGMDEVVPERVHEMQRAGRAVGVPPGGGQGGEVGDFGFVDGGGG